MSRNPFEEKVEYSNVTDFRKKVLKVVDELQEHPQLRYLLTKRGQPKAVVMSFQGYELVMKALKELEVLDARRDRTEALHDAFDRMAEEHWPEAKGGSRRAEGHGSAPTLEELSELMYSMVRDLDKLKHSMSEFSGKSDIQVPERPIVRR